MSAQGTATQSTDSGPHTATSSVDVQAWRARIHKETFGNYHYEMGRALQRGNEMAAAVEAFRRALAERPEHLLTHYHLIETLKASGRAAEAETLFAGFAGLQPRYWEETGAHALADAAASRITERRFAEAIDLIGQAAALAPEGEARTELVTVCLNAADALGAVPEAVPVLRWAFALAPDDAGVAVQYGMLCDRLERYEEAAAAYKAVLGLDPLNSAMPNALSVITSALCRFSEALSFVERSLVFAPGTGRTYLTRGIALHGLGRLGEAITSYRRAVRCAPDNPHTHAYLGYGLLAADDVTAAEEHIARAMRMEAGNPVLTTWSGLLAHRRGRLEEAITLYRRALELSPNLCIALMDLGLALEEAGRAGEAEQAFAQAVAHRSRALWQWVLLHPFAAERLEKAFGKLGYTGP